MGFKNSLLGRLFSNPCENKEKVYAFSLHGKRIGAQKSEKVIKYATEQSAYNFPEVLHQAILIRIPEKTENMGACQNCGPLLGPLNTRFRTILGPKKGP